ncbi:MAG TPA: DNA double-strand break repair nuclease NurA [Candidatus Korarchaeota archaeon]|nr:DNA double-strand break repair nuclease NurA [Candidatus Korarchaeota archaeon]
MDEEGIAYGLPGIFEREKISSQPFPRLFEKLLRQLSSLPVTLEEREESTISLFKNISFKRVEKEVDPDLIISAVDGGHNGKELEGFYFGIATAVAYTSKVYNIVDPSPLCDGHVFRLLSYRGPTWISLIEQRLIYQIALSVVDEKEPDFLLLDGNLLIRPPYLSEGSQEGEIDLDRRTNYIDDRNACIDALLYLLDECYKRGIALAGVVKRPAAQLLMPSKRDAAVLDKLMKVGEMVGPLLPKRLWGAPREGVGHPALLHYASRFRKLKGFSIEDPTTEGFIKVVYLKTTPARGPIRLEIPYWVDPLEVAGVVLEASKANPVDGIPVHILKADELAGVGSDLLRIVYGEMLAKLIKENPELVGAVRPVRGEEFEL